MAFPVSRFQYQLAPYPAILRRSGLPLSLGHRYPQSHWRGIRGTLCVQYLGWCHRALVQGNPSSLPFGRLVVCQRAASELASGERNPFPIARLPSTSAHESSACFFLSDTSSNTLAGCPTISSSRNAMVYEPLPQIGTGQHILVATLALLVIVVMISTCS